MAAVDDVMPYAEASALWVPKGWPVLPLPRGQKCPPPDGFTGEPGLDPTASQIEYWTKSRPYDNAALRLPEGVLGLDVDDYAGKAGAATWRDHSALYGALPETWTVVNRADGVSGTRLYRTTYAGPFRACLAGGGVDVIHRGHRYVTAPPSLHPDGRVYVLHDPSGRVTTAVPAVEDVPMLPTSWHEALSPGRKRRGAARKQSPKVIGSACSPPHEPLDQALVELATDSIRSGLAKPVRDAAGVRLEELAARLRLSTSRARHLESGRLRQVRPRLLEQYGRFLREHMYLVR